MESEQKFATFISRASKGRRIGAILSWVAAAALIIALFVPGFQVGNNMGQIDGLTDMLSEGATKLYPEEMWDLTDIMLGKDMSVASYLVSYDALLDAENQMQLDDELDKVTLNHTFGIVLLVVWLLWGEGGYMIAWAASLAGAILLLHIMSIPRYTLVSDTALEIHCVVEITRIAYADLRSIRRVGPDALHDKYVLLGGYGFFGYYGYYFDTRRWETVKLYCRERRNLVEITDITDQRYIVSCPEPDELIRTVRQAMHRRQEQLQTPDENNG